MGGGGGGGNVGGWDGKRVGGNERLWSFFEQREMGDSVWGGIRYEKGGTGAVCGSSGWLRMNGVTWCCMVKRLVCTLTCMDVSTCPRVRH